MTRLRRTARWLLAHWYVVVALLAAFAVVIWAWTWAGNAVADRKARGDRIVSQNDRVLECTTPGLPCFEDAQRRNRQTLAGAFAEIDCVVRRAISGLPALDPAKGSCAAQTPPTVYPG